MVCMVRNSLVWDYHLRIKRGKSALFAFLVEEAWIWGYAVVIVISGGAIWYYKSLPEKTPLSLLEVYVTDTFPSTLPIREDLLIDSKLSPLHLTILVTKYYEFTANSYYYSMYIPRSQYTYDLCTDLATNFSKRVSERFSWLQTSSRIPGDSSTMEESEMVFTGRVYLYTQDDLPPDKIGELYKVYKQHNFYLQYKGMEYLSHHLWEFERRNSDLKQFKEQPNHQNL